MKVRLRTKGYVDLSSGRVDITDPGYNRDVPNRINGLTIRPDRYRSLYQQISGFEEDEITAITKNYSSFEVECPEQAVERAEMGMIGKVAALSVVASTYKVPITDDAWENIAEIGVDSGMVGFFTDKPDYSDDEWENLVLYTANKGIVFNKSNVGFWGYAGLGDGIYNVYAIYDDDEIVALKIKFISV